MKVFKQKDFKNGSVYALELNDGNLIETTDTFLPMETINAVGRHSNALLTDNLGDRNERWMIGVSTMVGCYVGCKFCNSAGRYKRLLTSEEIVEQVSFIVDKNGIDTYEPKQFRVLFTRMGDPGGNMPAVCDAMIKIREKYVKFNPVFSISTVGLDNKSIELLMSIMAIMNLNVELQFSIHTTNEKQRDELMNYYPERLSFSQIDKLIERWSMFAGNERKVTLNFTLVEGNEFDVEKLSKMFNKDKVFIKLSPLNENRNTVINNMKGIIQEKNLL